MPGSLSSPRRTNPVAAHDDPGPQPERTALAWARTCLSLVVTSLFFIRFVGDRGPWVAGLIALAATSAAAFYATAQRRYRHAVRLLKSEVAQPAVISILTLTVVVATLAVGEVAFLMVPLLACD